MRRNESDFSSKILHRHRCLPLNNHPVIVLFDRIIFYSNARSAILIVRVNTQAEVPLLAHSVHRHIMYQYQLVVSA
jgi:hypothetical protein